MVTNENKMKKKCNKCVSLESPSSSHTSCCQCQVTDQSQMGLLSYVSNNAGNGKTYTIGVDQRGDIDFHVNTKLKVKSTKLWDHKYTGIILMFCVLFGQVVFSYVETQHLATELEVIRRQVDMLSDNIIITSQLYEHMQQKVTEIEEVSNNGREIVHKVNKRDVETQTGCFNCTRLARSVTRGKRTHCKNRNSCRSICCQKSGPFAIHLKGAISEASVRDGGIVAPWYVDKAYSGMFVLADGVLGEGIGIVEIVNEGLYFIYAQIYYVTSNSLNSYAINLQLSEGRGRGDIVIATCSAEAASDKESELSCYTAVVHYLNHGDRIFITQRERERKIIFRDNKSFLGLALLNSPNKNTH